MTVREVEEISFRAEGVDSFVRFKIDLVRDAVTSPTEHNN